MGYDQDIYNRISILENSVLDATSVFAVAKAAKDALDSRLGAFKVELDDAQNTRTTAQSNYALAQSTLKSVVGALKSSLQSTVQSLIIYKNVKDVFHKAYAAAELSMVTGYTMSSLLTLITAAEAKNSYITPQLLTLAQRTDNSAATAVSASLTAVQDAMAAFVAAERSVWASCLVVTSIVDVLHLMGGTTPDALQTTPRVPDLSTLEGKTSQELGPKIETILKEWLGQLLQEKDKKVLEAMKDQSLSRIVDEIIAALKKTAEDESNVPAKDSNSLLKRLGWLRKRADNQETILQNATTSANAELLLATQLLARDQALLDSYQKALSAAKQAVGA